MEHSGSLSAMARRRAVLCILAIIIAQIVARPALGQAAQWSNLATVSNSTSLQAGSLCATDGRDIYCNSSVATLSGLAQADRITSGTAGVYVSDSGIINLRTGGVTTGYFDTAGLLVAPGISITTANGISSTGGYFSGDLVAKASGNDRGISLVSTVYSSLLARIGQESNSKGRISLFVASSSIPYVDLLASGTSYINGRITIGNNFTPSATVHVYGTALTTSWTGINFSGSWVTPTAPLEVSGTVSATAINLTTTGLPIVATRTSATGGSIGGVITIKNFMPSSVTDGSGAAATFSTYTDIGRIGFYNDDIASGYVNGAFFIMPRTSASGNNYVQAFTVRSSGNVGIGSASPTARLEVAGSISATNIQLSRNATPPAAQCTSAADEGRTIMTADGPYVCLMR